MAIAWSRISSKVIAHPPEPHAACSRRCGNGKNWSDICIPQMGDGRKEEVLGVSGRRGTTGHHPRSRDAIKCRGRKGLLCRGTHAEHSTLAHRHHVHVCSLGVPASSRERLAWGLVEVSISFGRATDSFFWIFLGSCLPAVRIRRFPL